MNIGELSFDDVYVLTLAMEALLETPEDEGTQAAREDLANRLVHMWDEMRKRGVERVTLQAEEKGN